MPFTAGAYKVEITPPLGFYLAARFRTQGAQSVHDPLFAKALVFSQGQVKVAILTADVVGYSKAFVRHVKELVRQKTGILPESFVISATHTHSSVSFDAPPKDVQADFSQEFIDQMAEKMADAVHRADQAQVESQIGWGMGNGAKLLFNRRTKKKDGTVLMSFEMPAPDIAKELEFGPVDPEVGVLTFAETNGKPIATLINFGAHNVCTNDLYAISADYAGQTMKVIEEQYGGICLFSLGTAGNVVPIERGEAARQWIGEAVGNEVIRVLKDIQISSPDRVRIQSKMLDLPLKKAPPRFIKGIVRIGKRILPKKNPKVQMLLFGLSGISEFFEPYKGKSTLPVEVKLIRLGDLSLVCLDGEQFAEIGKQIKARLGSSFVISLCNQMIGYVPIASAYEEKGGFEQRLALLDKGAAEKMRDEVFALAKQAQHRRKHS